MEPGFTRLADARVAIVGLGLMGGSLALALAGRCRELIGVDTDSAALTFALDQAIIQRASDFDAALAAELIILATPVRIILAQLDYLTKDEGRKTNDGNHPSPFVLRRSSVVLDLGSTKSAIVAAMKNLPAGFDPLGGHPMCGKETGGIAHATPDLYRGKTFVLCPLERTSPAALALAYELIAGLGAQPLVLEAERHDAFAALISHLPYIVAAALVRAALAADEDGMWQMAASGFRDTTRLAASDLNMMVDILLTNRAAVLDALRHYHAELDSLTAAIDSADPAALRAILEPPQRKRNEMFK